MNKKVGASLVCAGLMVVSTQALAWGDRERAGLLGLIGGTMLANSWYNPPRVYTYPPMTIYSPPPRVYEYPATVVYSPPPPPRIYEYQTVYAPPPRYIVNDAAYIGYGGGYERSYRVYR